MANGKNYTKSYYDLVLKNLVRLGLLEEDGNVVKIRGKCGEYLEGESEFTSSEKGERAIASVRHSAN